MIRNKDEKKIEYGWKDYLAIIIAMLQTIFLPFLILIVVVLVLLIIIFFIY